MEEKLHSVYTTGDKVVPGKYKCNKCKKIELVDAEILPKCSCGSNEFKLALQLERSIQGYRIKLEEIITILETSILLSEILKLDAFYNVIALQLRILLCDNNKVLSSTHSELLFHPCSSNKMSTDSGFSLVLADDLFDKNQNKIEKGAWLNQEIAWSVGFEKPLTIKSVIKSWADKNGGAHVDHVLPFENLYADTLLGKGHLLQIAIYLIDLLGFDLEQDLNNKVIMPFKEKTI